MDLIDIKPNLAAILGRLDKAGGRPMIVGGAVRDALLGDQNPKDIDIECYDLTYDEIIAALHSAFDVDLVGAQYQVLTVRVDGESFDISLPRTETSTGPGHKDFVVEIDHRMDFAVASLRRDFTINAMGWDPFTKELIDPHYGRIDLIARMLRHVGPQFAEDPLRVLRGMQFASRFGMSAMATDTIMTCRSLKDEFQHIPISRIWTEWKKLLLQGERPSEGILTLRETEWLEHFPEIAALEGIRQDPEWHPEGDVFTHSLLAMDAAAQMHYNSDEDRIICVLGALCHDMGKVTHTQIEPDGRIRSKGHAGAGVDPATDFLLRIGAPVHYIAPIQNIVREHMCIVNGPPTKSKVRRLARRLDPATMLQWMKVVEADQMGRQRNCIEPTVGKVGVGFEWFELASEVNVQASPTKPILKGDVIIAMTGLKPGPVFAKIIKASIEAQDDDIITDEQSAEDWLQDHWREFI